MARGVIKLYEDIYQLRVCLGQLNALFGLERLTFSHYKSSSSTQWAAAATVCPFLKSLSQHSVSFLQQNDTEFTVLKEADRVNIS